MSALGARLGLVVVTHETIGLTGVGDWSAANVVQGAGAIMAILAKGFGHGRGAQNQEGDDREGQDADETEQVARVAESLFHGAPLGVVGASQSPEMDARNTDDFRCDLESGG